MEKSPSRNDKQQCLLLANQYKQQGQYHLAESFYRAALKIDPDFFDAWLNLGNLYLLQKQFEKAETALKKAAAIHPESATVFNSLGVVLTQKNKIEEAIAAYKKGCQLKPDYTDCLRNLGQLYHQCQTWQKAQACYEKVLSLQPHHLLCLLNMGALFFDQACFDQAEMYFKKALALNPDFHLCRKTYGMMQLLLDHYQEGFRHNESRTTLVNIHEEISIQSRYWDGLGDLNNKTTLIFSEQGVGDAIQFCRYIFLLIQKYPAGEFIFLVETHCVDLFKNAFARFSQIKIISKKAFIKEKIRYDFFIPLLSFAVLFNTTINTIPQQIPYLHVTEKKEYHDQRHDFVIGIAWKSVAQDVGEKRSIALSKFAELNSNKKIKWIDLQYGETKEERDKVENNVNFSIFHDEKVDQFNSMQDFVNQVNACDLIISIDNTTAHVAGALNKPCWVLLHYLPDWRWGLSRNNSLWYPSLILFRQTIPGEWGDVMASVKAAIKGLL